MSNLAGKESSGGAYVRSKRVEYPICGDDEFVPFEEFRGTPCLLQLAKPKGRDGVRDRNRSRQQLVVFLGGLMQPEVVAGQIEITGAARDGGTLLDTAQKLVFFQVGANGSANLVQRLFNSSSLEQSVFKDSGAGHDVYTCL